jgi:hypothetical protein
MSAFGGKADIANLCVRPLESDRELAVSRPGQSFAARYSINKKSCGMRPAKFRPKEAAPPGTTVQ